MSAFGPAQAIVKRHLATFEHWPPVSAVATDNEKNLSGLLGEAGLGR